MIVQTGSVGQPCGFPSGGIQCLVFNKQALFIKPQCLLQLDQNLFCEAVPVLLLQNQSAKKSAPCQAAEGEQAGLHQGQTGFDRAQKQCKGHRDQAECCEGGQPHHLFSPLIDFSLVQRIQHAECLLDAFSDHRCSTVSWHDGRFSSCKIADQPV